MHSGCVGSSRSHSTVLVPACRPRLSLPSRPAAVSPSCPPGCRGIPRAGRQQQADQLTRCLWRSLCRHAAPQPVGQGRALPAQTAAAALRCCARQWWDAQAGHEELKACCIYETSGARRRCAQQELRSAATSLPSHHVPARGPGRSCSTSTAKAAQQDFSTSFPHLSCLSPSCHYIAQYLLKKQNHRSCTTRSRLTRPINPEPERTPSQQHSASCFSSGNASGTPR